MRVCVYVTVMACIVRGIMGGERHARLAGKDNARKVCESCQEFVMQLEHNMRPKVDDDQRDDSSGKLERKTHFSVRKSRLD